MPSPEIVTLKFVVVAVVQVGLLYNLYSYLYTTSGPKLFQDSVALADGVPLDHVLEIDKVGVGKGNPPGGTIRRFCLIQLS